jgi:hypothetical protein
MAWYIAERERRAVAATLAAAAFFVSTVVVGAEWRTAGRDATIRLAQASTDDDAWKALEAEQERRRRAREPPATAADPATSKPERPRSRAPAVVRRPAAPARPAPKPRAVETRRPPAAAPAGRAAPAAPTAATRAAECYRAVGIPVDGAGRPLRDVSTAGERSEAAFIRCVDGR